jgi:antitoxin HigA-1
MKTASSRLDPVHPGDILREDFMKPLGLSAYAVARAIGSTPIAISMICCRKRGVSSDMALKLGLFFDLSPELWMDIQADYDLEVTRLRRAKDISKRVQPFAKMQRKAA